MRRSNLRPDSIGEDLTPRLREEVAGRPTPRTQLLIGLGSMVYLAGVHLTIGLRLEHIVLIGVFNAGLFAHSSTARLMRALAIFLVFGILYDSLKIVPNYRIMPVDIEGLYRLEQQLFGIMDAGTLRTPNEYFQAHSTDALDLISGLFYLNWLSVPIGFGVYLYAVNKRLYVHYGITFLLANIIGFIGYYLHPAAPPWYVELYGFVFQTGVQGSAAGLTRFDTLLGIDIFQSIYTRNSNVFAALPSLHSAYPVVVLWYAAMQHRRVFIIAPYAIYMLGIWFAAVYSGHHYVIDVALGVAVAAAGILLFQRWLLPLPSVSRLLTLYERSLG